MRPEKKRNKQISQAIHNYSVIALGHGILYNFFDVAIKIIIKSLERCAFEICVWMVLAWILEKMSTKIDFLSKWV